MAASIGTSGASESVAQERRHGAVSRSIAMLLLAGSKVSLHGGAMSAVSAPTGPAPAAEARGQFFGSTREYWRILSRDALALIATLGLYRFWVSNDVRRYLWSHTSLAGEQLD
jgi:NO-binding membrane sensor protein with MHYT domain